MTQYSTVVQIKSSGKGSSSFLPGQERAHAHVEARLRRDHFRLGEVDASVARMRHRKADPDASDWSASNRNNWERRPGRHHNLTDQKG